MVSILYSILLQNDHSEANPEPGPFGDFSGHFDMVEIRRNMVEIHRKRCRSFTLQRMFASAEKRRRNHLCKNILKETTLRKWCRSFTTSLCKNDHFVSNQRSEPCGIISEPRNPSSELGRKRCRSFKASLCKNDHFVSNQGSDHLRTFPDLEIQVWSLVGKGDDPLQHLCVRTMILSNQGSEAFGSISGPRNPSLELGRKRCRSFTASLCKHDHFLSYQGPEPFGSI